MSNEQYDTVIAEFVSLETRAFQTHLVYLMEFLGTDGKYYSKVLNGNPELGWMKVFKALGLEGHNYSSLAKALGNKVELVLEGDQVRYVNSLSPQQMYLLSVPYQQPVLNWWDKLKELFS